MDLVTASVRYEVHAATLIELVEHLIPEAEIAHMEADAQLKFAAADVIDAKRWARLREHSSALDALAESEGGIELKPARFDQEGAIANELRGEGSRIRHVCNEYKGKLKARKN